MTILFQTGAWLIAPVLSGLTISGLNNYKCVCVCVINFFTYIGIIP